MRFNYNPSPKWDHHQIIKIIFYIKLGEYYSFKIVNRPPCPELSKCIYWLVLFIFFFNASTRVYTRIVKLTPFTRWICPWLRHWVQLCKKKIKTFGRAVNYKGRAADNSISFGAVGVFFFFFTISTAVNNNVSIPLLDFDGTEFQWTIL